MPSMVVMLNSAELANMCLYSPSEFMLLISGTLNSSVESGELIIVSCSVILIATSEIRKPLARINSFDNQPTS